jgi:hypothetical protein
MLLLSPTRHSELVGPMKYIVEIVSPTALNEHALSRAVVECKDLAHAQSKAMPLLEIWLNQGATHARVLSADGNLLAEVRLPHAHAA